MGTLVLLDLMGGVVPNDESYHPTLETHLDCPRSFHFVHAVSYPRGGDQS
jgi:hypothetical protein